MQLNEHGHPCPVDWDSVPISYNWCAIDYSGAIWAYDEMPTTGLYTWLFTDCDMWTIIRYTGIEIGSWREMLWQRPNPIPPGELSAEKQN